MSVSNEVIGVLALQGAYQKHVDMLATLGVDSRLVRFAHELEDCAGLIIPGGESTTMSLLLQKFELYAPIQDFARQRPVMGVCAGAILMAETVDDERVEPLRIMRINVRRNHYGRQVNSFSAPLALQCDKDGADYTAHFIRAPAISAIDASVEVLARYRDEAVMLRQGRHLALSFHPELTTDPRVHSCWLGGFHGQQLRVA